MGKTLNRLERTVNNIASNLKSFNTLPRFKAGGALRELVAAMPIVVFANAVRAALQRPGVRGSRQIVSPR